MGYFIILLLIALPSAGLIWFICNLRKFMAADKAERKTVKLLVPLIISFFPAAFAVFLIVFIIGIFTGAISLM